MHAPSVYAYSDSRLFLLDSFAYRQKLAPGFSVRAWAKEMGLKSHTLLVMLLQGSRPIRVQHVASLAKGMSLTAQERLYFQALAQYGSASTPAEKQLCGLWLAELNPGKDFRSKELDEYEVMSSWLHTALLAMTDVAGFSGTVKDAHARIAGRASVPEVRAAIQRLLDLRLLEREPGGKLRSTYGRVTTKNDIASAAAKKYHREAMKLAADALDSSPIGSREFQSCSIAIPSDRVPFLTVVRQGLGHGRRPLRHRRPQAQVRRAGQVRARVSRSAAPRQGSEAAGRRNHFSVFWIVAFSR